MKGLIALDLDGTVTGERHLVAPEMAQGLKQISEQGWQIAFITGRVFAYAWPVLQCFSFPYLLAVQNGADILEMPEKKRLKRNYLSSSIVSEIDRLYQSQKEDFIIYAGIDVGDFCYFRDSRFSPKLLDYLEILKKMSAAPWKKCDFHFDKTLSFPLIKCFGEEEAMMRMNGNLKNLEGVEASWIRDPIDKSLFLNLVTDKDANKGKVVRYFKERTPFPVVIAAGDDRNDIPMLEEADVSIVIENAPKEVLELGNILAKPPEELGLLTALKEAITK